MVIMVKEDADDLKARTLQNLRHSPRIKAKVLLIHDFFIHNVIRYEYLFEEFIDSLKEAYEMGGGELPGFRQEVLGGGYASNIAFSLASLGVNCKLLIKGGEFAAEMATRLFPSVEIISYQGTPGLTTTLEFSPNINIEMSYPGSNDNFPPSLIMGESFNDVDLVSINNYWINRSGAELLQYVLEKTSCPIYLTTGNPLGHEKDFIILFNTLLDNGERLRISLSETEAPIYMAALGIAHRGDRITVDEIGELSAALGCSVDLHTPDYAITSKYMVPTFRLRTIYRSMRASNLWNGGNIFGTLMGLKGDERMVLANGLAGLRISQTGSWMKCPTLEDVMGFMEKNSLKAI